MKSAYYAAYALAIPVLTCCTKAPLQSQVNLPAKAAPPTNGARARDAMLTRYSRYGPRRILAKFNDSFSKGDYREAALFVSGANPKTPDLERLAKYSGRFGKGLKWEVDWEGRDDRKHIPASPVSVKVFFGNEDLGLSSWQKDDIHLRREKVEGHDLWRIVPATDEQTFTNGWNLGKGEANGNGIERMAAYLKSPERARQQLAGWKAGQKLKLLGLGMYQFSMDNDNKLPDSRKLDGLKPYSVEKDPFTSPLDETGTLSFEMNDKVSGIPLKRDKNSGKIVVFYDGKNGTLRYRYNGRSVACFLDGHVEFITPERAKTLRWNP